MYHIILNPVAGRGRTIYHLPVLTKLLKEHNLSCEAHMTSAGMLDGYNIAKKICTTKECSGIIAVGGDGTLQEVVAGMVDSFPHGEKIPMPLGILPAGSGNDFVMTLGGGKSTALANYKKKIEHLAQRFIDSITTKQTRTIDIITANDLAFLNIGNMGLDARVVATAMTQKSKDKGNAYIAAVYKSITQHKNIPLQIEADGDDYSGDFTLVAVCNGQYYGGGLRIAPTANLFDGKITLCMISGVSRPKAMALFPTIMTEQHTKLKIVKIIDCEHVRITLPENETLCLDGNLYPREGVIDFKVLPQVLDVFV